MPARTADLWERYKQYLFVDDALGFRLDVSRMDFTEDFLVGMEPRVRKATDDMKALEDGAIANPDENRMVGHYWLRNPGLAPDPEIAKAIETTLVAIETFAADVHQGRICPPAAERFRHVLIVGIGGSALGPEFVASALTGPGDRMTPWFFDNTDPDGIDRTLARLAPHLAETLTIVISKSGGTKETRNGQLEAQEAYRRAGLDPARHFVAVTSEGSLLDKTRTAENWLACFPMWDWVGGRTSELSAVGLLPAALQGIDIRGMLDGARRMDEVTRRANWRDNPAMWMALMWYWTGDGRGSKDMVVLPYKDRLELFSRYLQQLVMESLGKERDLEGRVVHQGIAVYGNKGSTDQHAYVQQLREGVLNFFVTFIEVLRDRKGPSIEVEPDVTTGDFLFGFLQGTRKALYENGRQSMTLVFEGVDATTIGALIALYERTVGFYASLVGVNAYHQPGVEAGKKAAGEVIDLQHRALGVLRNQPGQSLTVDQVATTMGSPEASETLFHILEHLAANGRIRCTAGPDLFHNGYATA